MGDVCRPSCPLKPRGNDPRGLEGFVHPSIIHPQRGVYPLRTYLNVTMATEREPRVPDLDESSAIDNSDHGKNHDSVGFIQRPLLIVVALALSPWVGFCWRLIIISFLSVYHYALFVKRSYEWPRHCGIFSLPMAKFAFNTAVKLTILAGLSVWCLSLTPFHIFLPTATDAWTPYAVHDPLRMTETMYDAGKETTVEFVGLSLGEQGIS